MNEHKAVLWAKLQRHLAGKAPLDTKKKSSKKKKTVLLATKQKKHQPLEKKHQEELPNLSCARVLQALLVKYQKKTLPSQSKLESEARTLLHEAEHELARAVSHHALASLQAHARVAKEPLKIESETETEEEEALEESTAGETTTNETTPASETETEEEQEELSETRSEDDTKSSLEDVLKNLKQSRLSKAQVTKQLAAVVQDHDFLEVYDFLTQHTNDIQHITKYEPLYNIVLKYARHVLQRASSEFPEGRDRDDFAVQEFLDIFRVFELTQTEADKFITDVSQHFPPTLKRIILRKLS
jgi:hypothetical protein